MWLNETRETSHKENTAVTWTRITDPELVAARLPAWFASRMVGLRGCFGLLLTTGDVLRVTSIAAAHLSSDGTILLDVLLDLAGVPDGADDAWRLKHYLGSPVPGATVATVNLAHIVAAVEFTVAEMAAQSGDPSVGYGDEIDDSPAPPSPVAVSQGTE
jgi:hypothetical protein